MWRNQSQWHFFVVNSTFIFTFIYGFLQALKQDNKKYLFKCTVGFPVQFQSVQCSSSTLIRPSAVTAEILWPSPSHDIILFFFSFLEEKKSTQQNDSGLMSWNSQSRPIIISCWKELTFTAKDTFFFYVSSLLLLIIIIWSHSLLLSPVDQLVLSHYFSLIIAADSMLVPQTVPCSSSADVWSPNSSVEEKPSNCTAMCNMPHHCFRSWCSHRTLLSFILFSPPCLWFI